MAKLAIIDGSSLKQRIGGLWMVCVRVLTGANQAAEWIGAEDIGLSDIISVKTQVVGATTGITTSYMANARGTGVAEGTNKGDVGIEASASAVVDCQIIGRGNRRVKGRARSA